MGGGGWTIIFLVTIRYKVFINSHVTTIFVFEFSCSSSAAEVVLNTFCRRSIKYERFFFWGGDPWARGMWRERGSSSDACSAENGPRISTDDKIVRVFGPEAGRSFS